LPVDLVEELEAIATAEGLGVEELVSRLLVDVLPGMVAQRTNRWLRATLSLAYPIEIDADVPGIRESGPDDVVMLSAAASSGNEESPAAGHDEALNGDEILQLHAEHQHTARPAVKGASGGRTT
jgi:hypothetical protein